MSTPVAPRPSSLAWIDASAGIAGDMLLAALLDAGASLHTVQAAVDAVLPGTVRLRSAETTRAGMRALEVEVELLRGDQPRRPWSEVRDLISRAPLPPAVVEPSLRAFAALASVEARIHGVEVEDVHFHEVGAWDSIADVVGSCAALAELGVSEVAVGVIAVGSGSVRGAHGRIPVPVPAVLGLSLGWAVEALGEGELATPTGVALVTTLASRQVPLPPMEVTAVGVGAGSKDIADRANVVRVVVGLAVGPPSSGDAAARSATDGSATIVPESLLSTDDSAVPTSDDLARADLEEAEMVVLEANVDDLDPRVWPSVLTALIDRGAADAWLTPIVMKKGRPAHTLSVLAHPEDAARLGDLVLAETSTIGVRATRVRRWALPRCWVDLALDGQSVAVKLAHRSGRIVHATPEFSDVEAAAEALGRPVRDVLEASVAASVAAGLVPGAPVPTADVRTEPCGAGPARASAGPGGGG